MAMTVDLSTVAWAALYLFLLILAAIFTGGIADQAQFGKEKICLLFVKDYHQINGTQNQSPWVFDAMSPACGITTGIGILGIVLAIALCIGAMWFMLRGVERNKRVIMAFLTVAAIYSVLMIIGASVASAGLSKTCSEFENNPKKVPCGAIFSIGFASEGDSTTDIVLQSKNIDTIRAAISAGWISVLGWAAYAGFEYWNWRKASVRWW